MNKILIVAFAQNLRADNKNTEIGNKYDIIYIEKK